jgi:hypothetical protein
VGLLWLPNRRLHVATVWETFFAGLGPYLSGVFIFTLIGWWLALADVQVRVVRASARVSGWVKQLMHLQIDSDEIGVDDVKVLHDVGAYEPRASASKPFSIGPKQGLA